MPWALQCLGEGVGGCEIGGGRKEGVNRPRAGTGKERRKRAPPAQVCPYAQHTCAHTPCLVPIWALLPPPPILRAPHTLPRLPHPGLSVLSSETFTSQMDLHLQQKQNVPSSS